MQESIPLVTDSSVLDHVLSKILPAVTTHTKPLEEPPDFVVTDRFAPHKRT